MCLKTKMLYGPQPQQCGRGGAGRAGGGPGRNLQRAGLGSWAGRHPHLGHWGLIKYDNIAHQQEYIHIQPLSSVFFVCIYPFVMRH